MELHPVEKAAELQANGGLHIGLVDDRTATPDTLNLESVRGKSMMFYFVSAL